MILGLGIDNVLIKRCAKWIEYSDASLKKIFNHSEIAYCKSVPIKSAERFAVRFAAKEAFFKALCSAYPGQIYYFFSIAPQIIIDKHPNGSPYIVHDTLLIANNHKVFVSLTHTIQTASAFVIIQHIY